MRDQESLKIVAKSGSSSLVTQTVQVGVGFGVMLAVTGGIVFVAVAEKRRLDVEHKQLVEKHRIELKND